MLLSIVTPLLNAGDHVAEAIDSVVKQLDSLRAEGFAVEHIVIDGGSTDGTHAVLARYPHLRVVIGPDRNLYDAINKGIGLAVGDVVALLNGDDLFAPGALLTMMRAFASQPDIDGFCGGVEVFADGPEGGRTVLTRIDSVPIKQLRQCDVISGVPLTNARFFRRSVFERVGLFDLRFPIASDRDFLMRVLLADIRRGVIEPVVYRYRAHARSLTFGPLEGRARCRYDYAQLTVARLAEATAPRARAAYRNWAAWVIGYDVFAFLRQGHRGAALRGVIDGWRSDPLWLVRFLRMAVGHWRERRQRHPAGVAV
jgi:glycosyltransferase involved in cell wall biosynthesis